MAKKKTTRRKLPKKARLRTLCDRLWSVAVRLDWGGRCIVCGNPDCEAHHLIPRQWEATRYDLRNGVALCSYHHKFDKELSPHQYGTAWSVWLRDHHPTFHQWLQHTTESGDYKRFEGTKNEQYYLEVLRKLREYVEPEDFERHIGVRLRTYLDGGDE